MVLVSIIVHIFSLIIMNFATKTNNHSEEDPQLGSRAGNSNLSVLHEQEVIIPPNPLCELDFCGNMIYHVSCNMVRAQNCTNVVFPDEIRTDKIKMSMLHAFNKVRNEFASGYGLDFENYFPGSSNMHKVEWSTPLENLAHRTCQKCLVDAGDDCRDKMEGSVGQLFFIKTYNNDRPPGDVEVFHDWFLDAAYLTPKVIEKYDPAFDNLTSPAILFWKLREIGCSSATITLADRDANSRLFICNMWPVGPIYGWPIYRPGIACEKCALGFGCKSDSNYPLLCDKYLPDVETINSSGPKFRLPTFLLFIFVSSFSEILFE